MMNMGFGFGWGWIVMALFWVIVIGGGILFLTMIFPRVSNNAAPGGPTSRATPTESPVDILKQRYARGEITAEQFERMRHDLDALG